MTEQEGILLRALDGSNPLAFLAALGTFRLLTLEYANSRIQMRWERADGAWRPRLLGVGPDEEKLCRILHESTHWAPAKKLLDSLKYIDKEKAKIGSIVVPKSIFRSFVHESHDIASPNSRIAADFAVAFGCEICEDEKKSRIECTDLCFARGSGKQFFLIALDKLKDKVTCGHVHDALFGNWRREKAEGMSMRWDPSDAVEYALQWDDPEPIGAFVVAGANRLASEALPFFPTAPIKGGLQTTGFKKRNGRDELTWPIWKHYLGCASVRSLMSLPELQENLLRRDVMHATGMSEIYRAERVWVGQGSNRKLSFRPARAL